MLDAPRLLLEFANRFRFLVLVFADAALLAVALFLLPRSQADGGEPRGLLPDGPGGVGGLPLHELDAALPHLGREEEEEHGGGEGPIPVHRHFAPAAAAGTTEAGEKTISS